MHGDLDYCISVFLELDRDLGRLSKMEYEETGKRLQPPPKINFDFIGVGAPDTDLLF
jgi:hypothetical protein